MIAARIALRIVPVLQDALCADEESRRARIILPSFVALAAASLSGSGPGRFRDVRQAARAAAHVAGSVMAETCNENQMNVIDSVEAVPEEHTYIFELESDRNAVSNASKAVDAIVRAVQAAGEMIDVANETASIEAVIESAVETAAAADWAIDGANGYEELHYALEDDRNKNSGARHTSTPFGRRLRTMPDFLMIERREVVRRHRLPKICGRRICGLTAFRFGRADAGHLSRRNCRPQKDGTYG